MIGPFISSYAEIGLTCIRNPSTPGIHVSCMAFLVVRTTPPGHLSRKVVVRTVTVPLNLDKDFAAPPTVLSRKISYAQDYFQA